MVKKINKKIKNRNKYEKIIIGLCLYFKRNESIEYLEFCISERQSEIGSKLENVIVLELYSNSDLEFLFQAIHKQIVNFLEMWVINYEEKGIKFSSVKNSSEKYFAVPLEKNDFFVKKKIIMCRNCMFSTSINCETFSQINCNNCFKNPLIENKYASKIFCFLF